MTEKNLKDKIIQLQEISQELEPTENERNSFIQKIHAYSNRFINEIDEYKTYVSGKEKEGLGGGRKIRRHNEKGKLLRNHRRGR